MRRLATVLLGLLLLVGIFVVVHVTPEDSDMLNPIPRYGEIGEAVDTGGFTLTVHHVRVAYALASGDDIFDPPPPLETDGIWVVITATVVGEWGPTTYSTAWLETADGTRYASSRRVESSVTLTEDFHPGPGIARRGQIVFEIPEDRLAGAVLHLERTGAADRRLGPEAVVDLGIDEAEAKRLLDKALKELTLRPVEFE